jgi:hypothetical protein
MDEAISIEDGLNGATADLVSEQRFEPFLRWLFSTTSGQWQGIDARDWADEVGRRYGEAVADALPKVRVSWLPDPYSDGEGYAVLLFFCNNEHTLFHNCAVYNKKRFMDGL